MPPNSIPCPCVTRTQRGNICCDAVTDDADKPIDSERAQCAFVGALMHTLAALICRLRRPDSQRGDAAHWRRIRVLCLAGQCCRVVAGGPQKCHENCLRHRHHSFCRAEHFVPRNYEIMAPWAPANTCHCLPSRFHFCVNIAFCGFVDAPISSDIGEQANRSLQWAVCAYYKRTFRALSGCNYFNYRLKAHTITLTWAKVTVW